MPPRDLQRRATPDSGLEIRSGSDGTLQMRGYAALFDVEAHHEVVRSSAFTRALNDGHDVRLLVNHDGVPLARTRSGTLRLSTDSRGLLAQADLDQNNPTVAELASAMDRGDIDQMSFAFVPVMETFSDEGVRELREVELWDVSVVTYPWYEQTNAELYAALDRIVEARGADEARRLLIPDPAPAAAAESPRVDAARFMFPKI